MAVCPHCQEDVQVRGPLPGEAPGSYCGRCGSYLFPAAPTPGSGNPLIPTGNPLALIAYYCGVFSLIPCVGLLLGPMALGLGIAGLKAHRRNPQLFGKGHAWAGIILGAITGLGNWAGLVVMIVNSR
jgi:hypothetical protein